MVSGNLAVSIINKVYMKSFLLTVFFAALMATGSAQTFSYAGVNYEIKNGVAYVAEGKYSGDITVQPVVNYGTSSYVVIGINEWAFKMSSVTSVSLPSSIIDIGKDAFYYCSSLKTVNIPSQVRVIREGIFTNCGLNSIFIPNSVDSIEKYAFSYCDKLTTINIPASVRYISDNAFLDCSGMTSYLVAADNSVEYEGPEFTIDGITYSIDEDNNLFVKKVDESLTSVNVPAAVTYKGTRYKPQYLDDGAFMDCNAASVSLPNGIKRIGAFCFANCINLKDVNIPVTVTSIEHGAFCMCKSLESISIPSRTSEIGLSDPRNYGVFYFCDNLKSISVSKDNPYYESGDDDKYLMHKDTKTLVALCPDTDIPQGTKILGSHFYTNNLSVIKAVVPNSVTETRPYSFFRCRNMSELILSRNLCRVDEYSFLDTEIDCVTLLNTKPADIVVEKYDRIFGKAKLVVPKGLTDAYEEIFPYDKNRVEYDYELTDVNHDGSVNTADVVKLYNAIINGVDSSDAVERVQPTADVNADCVINTADVVKVYDFIINGSGE